MTFLIGIDVGTGSARAGVFDTAGHRLGLGSYPIDIRKQAPDYYEQSSNAIWAACAAAVREALEVSGINASDIRAVAFDATCSLVVLDDAGCPVAVSPDASDEWNVIVWMDHRALAEAKHIDRAAHPLLAHVGGSISPEMQTPKLAWIKKNNPAAWKRAEHFYDLSDFLFARATGLRTRSMCTTVCKWGFDGGAARWDADWFARAGVGDLAEDAFTRIGQDIAAIGAGAGVLTDEAAQSLGLMTGTIVGIGAIDAHAGGIGSIGGMHDVPIERRLAVIAGTSSCHMSVSANPHFVEGIWGPYWGAMIPGLWLNEGGQSATGSVIDHMIDSHASGAILRRRAKGAGQTVYALLNEMARDVPDEAVELHVLPDLHGNRSPFADPHIRGMISGVALGNDENDLAKVYLATLQGLALGTRMIIERMESHGIGIDAIILTGGQAKNDRFAQVLSNASCRQILIPDEPEAMLLGGAIIAATAAGIYSDIPKAMVAMSRYSAKIFPKMSGRDFYERKYAVLKKMYVDQKSYRDIMSADGIEQAIVNK